MRCGAFVACALTLAVSNTHAFLPAPSATPVLSLRRSEARASHLSLASLSKKNVGKLSMVAVSAPSSSAFAQNVLSEASALSVESKGYVASMDKLFPGAVAEEKFIECMSAVCFGKGFNTTNSINLVSTCRDEICRPFTEQLDTLWGESFNIASLAGFVFCGKTGFGAGMAHSPQEKDTGKERYIFWVAPHIAYGPDDAPVGKIWRPGRESISSACGALIAFSNELSSGADISLELDPTDTEMSLVRAQVKEKLKTTHANTEANLVGVTFAAHDCIVEQVKRTAKMAAPKSAEYIIISGIQVHGAINKNFWWPGSVTHYEYNAQGTQVETDLSKEFVEKVGSYQASSLLQAEALAHVQKNAGKGRVSGFFSDVI